VTVDKQGTTFYDGADPNAANLEIVEWHTFLASANLDETFSCLPSR
jgi:hypothetical protein